VPHITLARLRAASAMAVADYLGTVGYFPGRMFEAKRFVLFSSRASTGGGPYVIEAAYPLG
jgi:2'-5' RNA ligase